MSDDTRDVIRTILLGASIGADATATRLTGKERVATTAVATILDAVANLLRQRDHEELLTVLRALRANPPDEIDLSDAWDRATAILAARRAAEEAGG